MQPQKQPEVEAMPFDLQAKQNKVEDTHARVREQSEPSVTEKTNCIDRSQSLAPISKAFQQESIRSLDCGFESLAE
jgi:hypothetical protein